MTINLQKNSDPTEGNPTYWEVTVGDYKYRLLPNGNALVFKGSAATPSYVIDRHGCNCRAFQYKGVCKHKSQLHYVGDGDEGKISLNDTDSLSDLLG